MCFAEDGNLTVFPVDNKNWKIFCIKSDPGGCHSGALTELCLNSWELKCFYFHLKENTKELNDLKVLFWVEGNVVG